MSFVQSLSVYSSYKDRSFAGNNEEWALKMSNSSTLYVGNLSFYTTEEQVYQLFSMAGELKRVIMGLDRNTKVPCGFCFVEYYIRENALDCLLYLNGTKLDERSIRTDIDPGFVEGRQYGRGKSGGQVRDEHRVEYDSGRGGIPIKEKERLERNRELDQREKYKETFDAPLGANIDGFGRSVVLKKTSDKRGRETRDTGNNRRRNDSDSD